MNDEEVKAVADIVKSYIDSKLAEAILQIPILVNRDVKGDIERMVRDAVKDATDSLNGQLRGVRFTLEEHLERSDNAETMALRALRTAHDYKLRMERIERHLGIDVKP